MFKGFPGGASGKEPACQCCRHRRCRFDSEVRKIPWEDNKATHSSLLPWRIPWAKEPGRLQSMELQRVGHDRSDLTGKHAPYCSGRWSGWVIDVISHCDRFIVMKATGTWLKGTGNCAPHFMVLVCYWPRTKLSCAQECSDWGSFSQNWQEKMTALQKALY